MLLHDIYIIDDGQVLYKENNEWKKLNNIYPKFIFMYNTNHVYLFIDINGKIWISSDEYSKFLGNTSESRELKFLDLDIVAKKICTDNECIYIADDNGKLWEYNGQIHEIICKFYVLDILWVKNKLLCITKDDNLVIYPTKKETTHKNSADCTLIDIDGKCFTLNTRYIKNNKTFRLTKELIFEELQTENFKLVDCISFKNSKFLFITEKSELWFVCWKPDEESDLDDMVYLEKIENGIQCIHILDDKIYFVDSDSELYSFVYCEDFVNEEIYKPNLLFKSCAKLIKHNCY